MSTGAQVAVLDARGVKHTRLRLDPQSSARPVVRLLAFAALGLYGALRWGTMLSPMPTGRMLGLLALAVVVAGAGPILRARSPVLIALLVVVAVILLFGIAGLPWRWIRHVRLALSADAIDQGLTALPNAFIPYTGINEWVRMVVVLGGGLLLLLGAVPLAFGPHAVSDARKAMAAVPLVALAIVPSTIVRPSVAYLHGLILFILLATFLWGERVTGRDGPFVLGIAALAGAAAMIAAPALDEHTPWFDYQSLARQLTPGNVEAFDWSQRYGPLNWPRTGREIVDVVAAHPDYWKTENLEMFRGIGWETGSTAPNDAPPAPSADAISRWSQTIQVTLRAVRTNEIIGAGYAGEPGHLAQAVLPGASAGTWVAPASLQPGDSYEVTTYSPRPSETQLQAAGTDYGRSGLPGELTMVLPRLHDADQQIIFPPFGSRATPTALSITVTPDATAALAASAYGPVYALAMRLRAGTRTPADYVQRVMDYLGHGYTYSETPPPSIYPIVSFLLKDRVGYCQQFAGAAALLLRMGGVPARVATGFTTGDYDRGRHLYVVSDLDAHAWVEAWFPRYGWVRFDPTPGTAPARSGSRLLPILRGSTAPAPPLKPVRRPETAPSSTTSTAPAAPHPPSTSPLPLGLFALLGIAVAGLILARVTRLREPNDRELVAELERAMVRCKRPLAPGATLAALEHRFRHTPEAAAYMSALRRMRFAGSEHAPTPAQRRALRAELGAGLGPLGRLRALWAFPPSWTPHWPRRSHRNG